MKKLAICLVLLTGCTATTNYVAVHNALSTMQLWSLQDKLTRWNNEYTGDDKQYIQSLISSAWDRPDTEKRAFIGCLAHKLLQRDALPVEQAVLMCY